MLFKRKKHTLIAISLLLMFVNINPLHVQAVDEPDTGTEEPTTPPSEENQEEGTTTPETPVTPPRVYSSNNYLASLTVNDATLSPAFSSQNTSYSVTLPANTTVVSIGATVADSRARVSGIGDFDVSYEVGSYDYEITVRAENGNVRVYSIHVTISSDPFVFTTLDGMELGFVVKDLDQLTPPDGFLMTEGSYAGEVITVFENESFPFSLVYLQNQAKKSDWYCYQNGTVTGTFRSLVINKNKFYYAGVSSENQKQEGYSYTSLNIVGEKLNGWKVNKGNNDTKVMLYLYNTAGKADYYIYDTEDQTLVNRLEFEVGLSKNERSIFLSPMVIALAIIIVIASIFLFTFVGEAHQGGFKENIARIKRMFKRGHKNKKDKDEINVDETVELVRTSKVKIYASLDEEKQPASSEVHESLEKEKPEAVSDFHDFARMVQQVNTSYDDEVDLEERTAEIVEEVILEEKTEDQPSNKAKKAFKNRFSKKKKMKEEIVEKTPKEPKECDEPVIEEVVEERPSEPLSTAVEETPYTLDEEAINEIQKYIDQLFYLPKDEKKDAKH